MPPKKKYKKVPLVVFGKLSELVWGSSLHNDDVKNGNTQGEIQGAKRGDCLELTQESTVHSVSVSTLESDLNMKILEENAR